MLQQTLRLLQHFHSEYHARLLRCAISRANFCLVNLQRACQDLGCLYLIDLHCWFDVLFHILHVQVGVLMISHTMTSLCISLFFLFLFLLPKQVEDIAEVLFHDEADTLGVETGLGEIAVVGLIIENGKVTFKK